MNSRNRKRTITAETSVEEAIMITEDAIRLKTRQRERFQKLQNDPVRRQIRNEKYVFYTDLFIKFSKNFSIKYSQEIWRHNYIVVCYSQVIAYHRRAASARAISLESLPEDATAAADVTVEASATVEGPSFFRPW
jgi:hypothetical protein